MIAQSQSVMQFAGHSEQQIVCPDTLLPGDVSSNKAIRCYVENKLLTSFIYDDTADPLSPQSTVLTGMLSAMTREV